jgi:hypothetical protein
VEEEKNGITERTSRPFGFKTVAVFDYAQTDGEPLPELNTNATEGGDALLPLLERQRHSSTSPLSTKPSRAAQKASVKVV